MTGCGGGALGCGFLHHGWTKSFVHRPCGAPLSSMKSSKPWKKYQRCEQRECATFSQDSPESWQSRMGVSEKPELTVHPQTKVDLVQEAADPEKIDIGGEPATRQEGQSSARSSTHLKKDAQTEFLKKAREKSKRWMDQAGPSYAPKKSAASSVVDKKSLIYKQLASSRNILSSRLSQANKYISFMERKLETNNATVLNAFECTEKVARELVALSQMLQTAAAGAKFGVNEEAALEKFATLQERIALAQEAIVKEKSCLDELVPRRVPVSWYGVAMNVQLMGSFDNWTRGVELSAGDMCDNVFTEFTAELHLLPGTHEVKFLVDGEWKTAPDWPMVTKADGSTNNTIVVE